MNEKWIKRKVNQPIKENLDSIQRNEYMHTLRSKFQTHQQSNTNSVG